MNINVVFTGIMVRLAGQSKLELILPDSSNLGEAIRLIGEKFNGKFPPDVWDEQQGTFTQRVKLFVNSADTNDLDQILKNGNELLILIPAFGG
jgi:molybdopterin converting factor small subunit